MYAYYFFLMVAVDLIIPESKVHGAKMGPTWVLSAPDGPHVGPMNLAIRVYVTKIYKNNFQLLISGDIHLYWRRTVFLISVRHRIVGCWLRPHRCSNRDSPLRWGDTSSAKWRQHQNWLNLLETTFIPCNIISYYVMPCHAMPCHVMSCHTIPCHTILYIMSWHIRYHIFNLIPFYYITSITSYRICSHA